MSNPALPISVIVPGLDREANAVRAAGLAENARAENTRRAYESDWRHFAGWRARRGLSTRCSPTRPWSGST